MKRKSTAATVATLCDAMDSIAPRWAAAEWDNVGLIAGDRHWAVRRALVTVDLTPPVLDEAIRLRCQAIISYHPPIFKPVTRLIVDAAGQEAVVARALARNIAIYSPHTALDAAPGGTNDVLARLCDIVDPRPFTLAAPVCRSCKIVVFVPARDVDKVAEAMFAAGAGRIGEYEKCSFRTTGHGTFLGSAASNPRVGRRQQFERVEEIRIEAVVPSDRVTEVTDAMRRAHSYEEPAFDVYDVRNVTCDAIGQGRMGLLKTPVSLGAMARRLGRSVGATGMTIVGEAGMKIRRAMVCAGAAGSLPFDAETPPGPGDVVVTGEIRHHDALRYARVGAAAIALGHWTSERPAIKPLAARLSKLLPVIDLIVSRADHDPLRGM